MTVFPIDLVRQLRGHAAAAAMAAEDGPSGWSISPVDPVRVVAVFDTLRLKPGYILRAYQFREGGNGNGFVYAVPAGKTFPPPGQCPRDKTLFLEPPVPEHALPDVMAAVEGDGSPLSYLQASLLNRELAGFGAMWHGCDWSEHMILGEEPFSLVELGEADLVVNKPVGPEDNWEWKRPKPKQWSPTVSMTSNRIRCSFYTLTGLGQDRITRHTDSYAHGEYTSTTRRYIAAWGPGGCVF
jgi:hypothetical protein